LLSLTLVCLSSVTGVGGVSSVAADRGVTVAVVDDAEAYLGIEFGPVDNDTRNLTVYNRVSTGSLEVTVNGTARTAAPGDPAEFAIACGSEVEIVAVGSAVRVEATRAVDCPA
jgi:hypothetical protein